MTARILKSSIGSIEDFPARAAAFAVEMKEWRAHDARMRADEVKGVTGIEKHWAHPRPTAHPLIEAAVNENSEMDYELVDDGPTAEQILRMKKNDLLSKIHQAESAAIGKIFPYGKQRFLNIRENEIRSAIAIIEFENARAAVRAAEEAAALEFANNGFLKSVSEAIGLRKTRIASPPPIAQQRAIAPEDDAFLKEQDDRRSKIEAIQYASAKAQHDIEDLSADTIDAWQAPAILIGE
jgi:hypothetical protein